MEVGMQVCDIHVCRYDYINKHELRFIMGIIIGRYGLCAGFVMCSRTLCMWCEFRYV